MRNTENPTAGRASAGLLARAVLSVFRLPSSVFAALGPVFDKELRVSSRRRRHYVLRAGYLLALTLFVGLAWAAGIENYGGSVAWRQARAPEIGKAVVGTVVVFEFLVLQIVAALMLSMSISEEVHRGTLGVLMATPVRGIQVVLGKLLSVVLQVVLLVAVSLPLLVVVRVFGGVPWGFVGAGLSITLATALLAGSMGLFISTLTRRPFAAALLALLGLLLMFFVYIGANIMLLVIAEGTGLFAGGSLSEALQAALAALSPYGAMQAALAELVSPGAAGPMTGAWPAYIGVALGASALLVGLSAARVRRVGLEAAAGEPPKADVERETRNAELGMDGRGPAVGARAIDSAFRIPSFAFGVRTIHGSPVVWKELRGRLIRRRGVAAIVIGGLSLLVVPLDILIIVSATEYLARGLLVVVACLLAMLGLVGAAIPAAASIASEKEARTLPILLSTPLRSAQIILGKAVGAMRRSLPLWVPLLVHGCFLAAIGRAHVVLPACFVLIAGGATAFLTGTGLLLSACLRRTPVAILVNVGLGIVLWAIAPIALGFAAETSGSGEDIFGLSLCCHPVVQAGVATHGAMEREARQPYWANMRYDWPPPLRVQGCLVSLAVIGLTAFGYASVGASLAVGAGGILRRRAAV